MTRTGIYLATCVLSLAAALPAAAQDDDLRKEIEELKKGQQEILKILKELQKQPAGKPAAPKGPDVKDVILEFGDNPVVGSDSAKVTILEFTDYQ